MLPRISSEPLMLISNKHNYKTFSKSPPASLIYCIGNILSHSSGKWCDSLTIAALSFTFVQYLFTDISLATSLLSAGKKMAAILLSFPSRTSLWYSKRVVLLNN